MITETTPAYRRRFLIQRALKHLRRLQARQAAYDEECREWARQGYRAHYCIHGTNQWTDYDNICGPCEDGLTIRELALVLAHDDVHEIEEREVFYKRALELHLPKELLEGLVTWAIEPLIRVI